jgi:hypothetical protein
MTQDRLSVFDNADDLDLSTFKPERKTRKLKPPHKKVRAVSEAAKFPSREGRAPAAEASSLPEVADPPKRKPRYHRTGRTAPLNCRVLPSALDKLYAIADQQGWLVGQTVERAFEALERELAKGAGQGKRSS